MNYYNLRRIRRPWADWISLKITLSHFFYLFLSLSFHPARFEPLTSRSWWILLPEPPQQFAFYRNTLAMKNQITLFYWVFVSMCCLPLTFGIVEKDLLAKKNLCSIKRILARATRKVRACDWVQSISVRATILEVLETSLLHDRFLIAILAVSPVACCL